MLPASQVTIAVSRLASGVASIGGSALGASTDPETMTSASSGKVSGSGAMPETSSPIELSMLGDGPT
jgi:hypothetical protein